MATRTDADAHVHALRSSVARLRDLAAAISETDLTGRAYLDPEHTPPGDHGPALDTLRRVFPGP